LREYKVGNDKFDEYYRRQFVDIIPSLEEFEEFKKTLVDKLPVTFRVNPGLTNYKTVVEMFKDPKFLEKYATQHEEKQE